MAAQLPTAPPPPPGTGWRDFMDLALQEGFQASREGEAPVGAVLIDAKGTVLARGHNQPVTTSDPTAHAEVLCLRRAAERLGNYRLSGSILVVTLEPCIMCTGALIHARVAGVVYGAADPRAGALVSNLPGHALPFANHHMWTVGGVMEEECAALIKRFFLERRKARRTR